MGKIVKGVAGSIFGKKKRKAATEPTGPIITPLDGAGSRPGDKFRRKKSTVHASGLGVSVLPTILSDKLGA